jgi:hypothetical protein
MMAADHPELAHSVILFAAGGKVPPAQPAEQALKTIFNPAATDADLLEAMKFLVTDPKEIPEIWQIIKPCRAPKAAAMQGRRWQIRHCRSGGPLRDAASTLSSKDWMTRSHRQRMENS